MPDLVIRPYQPADRQPVFRIGADTAFFGAPIEAYMEDRNAFLDAFYAYYTDQEPEHTWVACADGEVVGFLAGCVDTRVHNRKLLRVIIPRLTGNLLRGKYHFGKRSLHYFSGLLGGLLRREFTRVDLDTFPALLHINVESAWRGYKLGQRLMEAYLGQLRELGITGVYLDTTSLNEVACRLYEKMGFRLLDARPDRFWAKWFGHPVDNRCYGLKLLG
ncbi:MAG: GNAT family N-acetyltransferase [Chloroflexi bacterium]|nr:GNAT family N-acetyltransferase [Chloroflexota bacterium]